MLKLLKKIVGTIVLVCGSLLFLLFTVDLSADIRIAGPMNMWPPPAWVYLILDSIFVLLAFVGIKMMRLKRIVFGSVMGAVGACALIFIVKNQVNAPPREGFNDGRYIPEDLESYVLAYMIATSVLSMGLWFIIRRAGRQKLS
jgi:hypothetical protein